MKKKIARKKRNVKQNISLRQNDIAPVHYGHGRLEPWDVIKDWKLDYFTGCALKYICRHQHKGNPDQDIQKAVDYLVEYKKTLQEIK